MSTRFKNNWAADIAAISELPQFQNCIIEIRNPLLITTTRDFRTGTTNVSGNSVIATGRARLIGVRAVVEATDGILSDSTNIKPIRIQLPRSVYSGRINRGWQIRVLDGGNNPRLESMVFIVRSDVQGSNMASRTLECAVDVEAIANWLDSIAPGDFLYPSENLYPSDNLYPVG